MLKNSFVMLFFSLFAAISGHCWEFEKNLILEGILRQAERTIVKNPNGEKETRIERSVVLVTDEPLVLTHSVTLGKQQIASTDISYPHIEVCLPVEFIPLIGKRVQCSGTFRKTFDFYENEIVLDVDTALDCEQTLHQLNIFFYEPDEVELSGLLYEIVYPGPPEYTSVETGDHPEKVVILTLKEPINVEIKVDKEDGNFNESEKGVLELQVVFSDSIPSTYQMREEVTVRGTLYHAHTAHHHRRVLMLVKSWEFK